MNRILGIAITIAIGAAGCLNTTAADGSLKCASGNGEKCPTGYFCAADSTCWHNGHTGPTTQATCSDGIKNGKETDKDCGGGTCPACPVGDSCGVASDCLTALCKLAVCATPPQQCQNGVQDPGETDVDCGGSACAACPIGDKCGANSDCISMICDPKTMLCVDQCNDGKQDGDETDIDCGGSCTGKCVAAQSCGLPNDCASNACSGGFCIAASGPPNWVKVADYPSGWTQYLSQTAAGPDGVIYMLGGCTGDFSTFPAGCSGTNIVSSYAPLSNTFSTVTVPPIPHARAAGGAALSADGKIYVMEGFSYNSTTQAEVAVADVDAYDPAARTWTASVATLTVASTKGQWYPATVAGASGEIYSFGGNPIGLTNPASSVVIGFTPSTAAVDESSITLPEGVYGAAAERGQNGNIYVLLGGCKFCTGGTGAQIYNETQKTWATYVAPVQLPTDRYNVGSAAPGDGRIYVVGGFLSGATAATTTAVVEAYTPKTNNWATVASMTTDRTFASTALGPDGRIYALGGLSVSNSTGTFKGTIEAYGPIFNLVSAKGSVGTIQGLTGSNFAASSTVSIYFGTVSTPVATTTTDATGQITGTLTYHVPAVAAGVYRITAVDNKSSYPVYSNFTVQ